MMAAGTLLYAIGFAMYGFVPTFTLFAIAMIVITIGEMIVSPFQQSLVASFAPEEMRGRYMAVSGLTWSIAFAIGPYFAGLILDGTNPNLLWVLCGGIGLLATLGFTILNKTHRSRTPIAEPAAAD